MMKNKILMVLMHVLKYGLKNFFETGQISENDKIFIFRIFKIATTFIEGDIFWMTKMSIFFSTFTRSQNAIEKNFAVFYFHIG